MTLTKTPICDFGKRAENFELKSTENKIITLNDAKGHRRAKFDLETNKNAWLVP